MKSYEEMETTLKELGIAWPKNESLVDCVLDNLKTELPSPISKEQVNLKPEKSRKWKRVTTCVAASLVILFFGWYFQPDNSLFAQVRKAVQEAHSLKVTIATYENKNQPAKVVKQTWYQRGVGFREETPETLVIANKQNTWKHSKNSHMVVRSGAIVISEIVDRSLDEGIRHLLQVNNGSNYKRFKAGDQTIRDQPCQAYLISSVAPKVDRELQGGKRRLVMLLDNRSRLVQIIDEKRDGENWIVQTLQDWNYDSEFEQSVFNPKFANNITVVDVDASVEEFVDLSKAVHREERKGLIYAIHHAEHFEGGGIFVISSVRGTSESLRKYPLKRTTWGGGRSVRVTCPAINYYGDPLYFNQGFDIELASIKHEGIHISWRVLIPFDNAPAEPFRIDSGQFKIRAGFSSTSSEFSKAVFMDNNNVHHPLKWDVLLHIEQPASLPKFDEIVGQVYTTLSALNSAQMIFLNMGHRGCFPSRTHDLTKVTQTEYLDAVKDDIRWWKEGGPQDDPRSMELRGIEPSPTKNK